MSLIINNLTKSFSDKKIFSDFSYKFEDKGIYILVGDSGVGKTTLLRMIAGLDNNFDGVIVGGGFENVSFAFQEYRLFDNLCALDNVIFANYDIKSEAEIKVASDILIQLGFSSADMNLFPSELSGGMKQRVSLARAFVKNCPILLLDEPTKELDPDNVKLVMKLIESQSKDRLVIMVTHNLSDVDMVNSVKITINSK